MDSDHTKFIEKDLKKRKTGGRKALLLEFTQCLEYKYFTTPNKLRPPEF